MNRPIIGITIGDPSGIGPEIVIKALNKEEIYKICKPIVIGDKNTLLQAMKFCSIELAINSVTEPENGEYFFGTIDMIDLKNVDINLLEIGRVQAMSGKSAYESLRAAILLALDGKIRV